MGVPEISVILPAFNEGKVILENLKLVEERLQSLGLSYEIIVVNDGSKDDTYKKAMNHQSPHLKVLSYEKNKGKGFAVNYGMKNAVGRYMLFMDMDLATSLDEVQKFLITIKNYRFDVLIGNRKIDPNLQIVRQPLYRRVFGVGFTWLSSIFVGRKFTDFTCGFKMFNAPAAKVIFDRQRIFNWAFDTEILYIALVHKLVIHEIPVVWKDQRNSKVRVVRDIWTSLLGLISVKVNGLLGRY